MRSRLLVVVALGSGLWACSGNTSDAPADTGGAAGNRAAGASGGDVVAGAGGRQGSAGTSGTAGSVVSVAGASGDTSGTGACPVWPRARLMPIIGPFFYGMDPGPCSDATGTTYTYEAGRLLTATDHRQVTTTYEYDAQGTLTGSTSSDQTSEVFEFGADYLLDIQKNADGSITGQYRYTLTPNGYPIALSIDRPGNPTRFGSYSYSNCRLAERAADLDLPEKLSYAYDSEGHVSMRVCECTSAAKFDYSCWQ